MKTYCYSCGAKMEFSLRDKPKFCSKCGTPLDQSKGSSKANFPDENAEEEDENVKVPNMSELNFEIEGNLKPRSERIGDLMGTRDSNDVNNSTPLTNHPKITNEQAMEQFKKEAGSLRQGSAQKDDGK